jgi:hypothetical protein
VVEAVSNWTHRLLKPDSIKGSAWFQKKRVKLTMLTYMI